jgi:hypothetical protein
VSFMEAPTSVRHHLDACGIFTWLPDTFVSFLVSFDAHSASLAAARLAAQRSSTRPGTGPSVTQLLRAVCAHLSDRFPQRMPIRIVHAASRGRAGNEDVHK